MVCRYSNLIVLTILFAVHLNASMVLNAGTRDEVAASPDAPPVSKLQIQISDVEASLMDRRQSQEFTLRLIIAVSVKNDSDSNLTLAREQFSLMIDGEPSEIGSVDGHESFPRSTLKPEKSVEGWIGFGSIPYRDKEPSIVLRWRPSTLNATEFDPVEINLNDELRKQSDFRQTRIGPEGCLLQITTNRNLDVLAIWPAEQLLKAAATEKIGRILFCSERETPPVIHEEFSLWLSGMIETGTSAIDPNLGFMPRINPPFPRQEIRFQQIIVGGMSEAVNRRLSLYVRPITVFPSAETAIANALTPIYRHVAIDLAVADLKHTNPGVRRAAIAGSVDRLLPEQASGVVEEVLHGDPEAQIELAGYLNLIPGEKSIDALRVLSRSDHPQVALAALRSLIQSLNPNSEAVLKELWQAGKSHARLQNQILSVIIQANGERWTPLVADYVSRSIEAEANPSVADVSVHDVPAELPDSDYEEPIDSFVSARRNAPVQSNLLESSLNFLRQQHHAGTLVTLRRHLLQLPDSGLQDIAISMLIEAKDASDETIIRECLDRRIRSEQITESVREAIVQLPSPLWTEMLLTNLKAEGDANRQASSADAMLRCATAIQLDGIIDQFDSLPDIVRQRTLRYLATLDHPRWKSLAKNLIDAPLPQASERNTSHRANARSIALDTIHLLAVDASEESIAILTSRLERAILEIGTTEDLPLESRRFIDRLIESISMFVHPECRRSLNRTARCNNPDLRLKAAEQQRQAMERSPVNVMIRVRQQNIQGDDQRLPDNEETIAFYDECIDADPFLAEIYNSRSSVLMHLNRFEETMRDLKVASRLSPENIDVESMIALCQIRLGETDAGLKYAEELVVTAPHHLSSLYNGACCYSRAIENPNVAEDHKQNYGDRAIELIRRSIAERFHDAEHLLKDEDLVAIHSHPEWPLVVEETKAMREENRNLP